MRFDDELRPGETVDVSATAADSGTYWLGIDEAQTTVSIPNGTEPDGRAVATLPVPVPDDATGSLTVRVRGGPVHLE